MIKTQQNILCAYFWQLWCFAISLKASILKSFPTNDIKLLNIGLLLLDNMNPTTTFYYLEKLLVWWWNPNIQAWEWISVKNRQIAKFPQNRLKMNKIAKFGRQKKQEFLFKQDNSHAWRYLMMIWQFCWIISFMTNCLT